MLVLIALMGPKVRESRQAVFVAGHQRNQQHLLYDYYSKSTRHQTRTKEKKNTHTNENHNYYSYWCKQKKPLRLIQRRAREWKIKICFSKTTWLTFMERLVHREYNTLTMRLINVYDFFAPSFISLFFFRSVFAETLTPQNTMNENWTKNVKIFSLSLNKQNLWHLAEK